MTVCSLLVASLAPVWAQAEDKPRVKVRLAIAGFTAHQQTWDHALQVDGKGDEVYISYDLLLVDAAGQTLLNPKGSTNTYGDTNGYANRTRAGSASSSGGIISGDKVTVNRTLWDGWLTEGADAMVLVPAVWEWDGGNDLVTGWGRSLVRNGPKLANLAAAAAKNPASKAAIKLVAEGIEPFFALLTDITGQAGDRPIGMLKSGSQMVYDGQAVILTYTTANLIADQTHPDWGRGILELAWQDDASIGSARYSLYLRVTPLETYTPPTPTPTPTSTPTPTPANTPTPAPTSTPTPTAAADQQCFPETGQCIGGTIRAYWHAHGGLPVFGYPISPVRDEVNRDTGQTYLTQWFERNRLERHPENAVPYDVLLGRLGDDRLRQLGIDWRTLPPASGPTAGCLWFEETQHNVCDQAAGVGFMTYWQTHGLQDPRLTPYQRSLALFGLPLTEPRLERNSSGDEVLTQWFERARFEWHPDKPDEFKVLLGLLGQEVRVEVVARP
jgi:hypothetical protein